MKGKEGESERKKESGKVNASEGTMPKRKYSRMEWSVLMSVCIVPLGVEACKPFIMALHLCFYPWAQDFFLCQIQSEFFILPLTAEEVSGFITVPLTNTVKAVLSTQQNFPPFIHIAE